MKHLVTVSTLETNEILEILDSAENYRTNKQGWKPEEKMFVANLFLKRARVLDVALKWQNSS